LTPSGIGAKAIVTVQKTKSFKLKHNQKLADMRKEMEALVAFGIASDHTAQASTPQTDIIVID
jgi:hypothetical protein